MILFLFSWTNVKNRKLIYSETEDKSALLSQASGECSSDPVPICSKTKIYVLDKNFEAKTV